MEGACSCFRGGHFNEGRMIMLTWWPVWRENGYTEVVTLMGGRMVML